MHPSEEQSVDYLLSNDGTTIGYRKLGQGPGLILVHGAASSGYNHIQLAKELADTFTVYVPDRRGRGLSHDDAGHYEMQKEVEDLEALLIKTGSFNVFGVSSGGVICLQAALHLKEIQKVAIYEPPFFIDDPSKPVRVLARYEKEMAEGRLAAAMVTGMKGAQMGPKIFNLMPT
jgi:pimeloyl-ACP methyl ester carboxylesterase